MEYGGNCYYSTILLVVIFTNGRSIVVYFFPQIVPPTIWMQNQLVGAQIDQSVTLECMSEAFPKSIDYWTRNKTNIVTNGKEKKKKNYSHTSQHVGGGHYSQWE